MNLGDLAGMAMGNLWRQKLRTGLTVVGVAVGVAALVLMVSLGIGIKQMILKQLYATNLLTEIAVTPMKIDFGALLRGGRVDRPPTVKQINRESLEALRAIPGVRAVYPNLNLWVQFSVEDRHSSGELYGLPPEGVVESLRESIVAGRVFADGTREVMISDQMVRELLPRPPGTGDGPPKNAPANEAAPANGTAPAKGPAPANGGGSDSGTADDEAAQGPPPDPALILGKKLKVTGGSSRGRRSRKLSTAKDETVEFEIVGVYSATAYKSLGPSRLYGPLLEAEKVRFLTFDKEALEENPKLPDEYQMATVRVIDLRQREAIAAEIDKLGYGTATIQDVIEMVENVFLLVEAGLGCIGGVGLLVAFFGIANTMLMSILERTREIGIMKAVGGTRWNIACIFLVEASAIGVLGGGVGIGGGWLLGKIGNVVATWYGHNRGMERGLDPFEVSLWLAGGAMAFSVCVSVAAGLYPAWRAARLDPVVALRHE